MTPRCFALALFLLLNLAIAAECSIYRTTIAETIDDNDDDREMECSRESMQHLSACRECIHQGWKLMMVVGESRLPRCCQQLQAIREDCRCSALEQMAQEGGHGFGEEPQEHEKIRRAQDLAFICGIKRCSIH